MNVKNSLLTLILVAGTQFVAAQINLGEKALGALQKGMAGFTFSNEQAAALAKEGVRKLDSASVIAGPKDGYTLRLNRIFGKHAAENGLQLNYKVYLTKEVNAFACADGSVRVYSGLMDIMDDNQLLAVIGHEIGHVVNEDSKDAMRAALKKSALMDALSSQSDKIGKVTDGEAGQIASAVIDSKYSRTQESEADTFAYDFMKKHGYDVNAVESAFLILAKLSEGAQTDFISRILSSHPDPKDRAQQAHERAVADKLYKAYVQKPISNKVPTPPKKKPAKKKK
ncbi:M48 family metalloprotease [Flavobacterium stagni]|uniref:Peptidase n=1 Tax=Flavobacterium stagni TaxID=2506421 RepID=A0A4Q1KD26_9FLAO|nr:M48 family metalloprotease [Flavobacterium stagni]RXR24143.1 peptidase [Flavobacterium stagni]